MKRFADDTEHGSKRSVAAPKLGRPPFPLSQKKSVFRFYILLNIIITVIIVFFSLSRRKMGKGGDGKGGYGKTFEDEEPAMDLSSARHK